MRVVAIAFACLLLANTVLAAQPGDGEKAGIHDECLNRASAQGPVCLRIVMPNQTPSQALGIVGPNLFLWLGTAECRTVDCARPPIPSDNAITGLPGLVGVLYGDTNGIPGLQRTPLNLGGTQYPPDKVVLV